jgi:hypothetical protein
LRRRSLRHDSTGMAGLILDATRRERLLRIEDSNLTQLPPQHDDLREVRSDQGRQRATERQQGGPSSGGELRSCGCGLMASLKHASGNLERGCVRERHGQIRQDGAPGAIDQLTRKPARAGDRHDDQHDNEP